MSSKAGQKNIALRKRRTEANAALDDEEAPAAKHRDGLVVTEAPSGATCGRWAEGHPELDIDAIEARYQAAERGGWYSRADAEFKSRARVAEIRRLRQEIRDGVAEASSADALIFYQETGECQKGALVELGAALHAGVPVYWIGPEYSTAPSHRLVRHAPTVAAAISEIMGRQRPNTESP